MALVRTSALDFDLGAGSWQGGAAFGNKIWLADTASDRMRGYNLTGVAISRQTAFDFNPGVGFLNGGTTDGNTIWIATSDSPRGLRAFDFSLRSSRTSDNITLSVGLTGCVYADGLLFVFSGSTKAAAYLPDGTAQTARDIATGHIMHGGVAYDGVIWIVDDSANVAKAYNVADGARLAGQDVDLGSKVWTGGFNLGHLIWFVNDTDNKAVCYQVPATSDLRFSSGSPALRASPQSGLVRWESKSPTISAAGITVAPPPIVPGRAGGTVLLEIETDEGVLRYSRDGQQTYGTEEAYWQAGLESVAGFRQSLGSLLKPRYRPSRVTVEIQGPPPPLRALQGRPATLYGGVGDTLDSYDVLAKGRVLPRAVKQTRGRWSVEIEPELTNVQAAVDPARTGTLATLAHGLIEEYSILHDPDSLESWEAVSSEGAELHETTAKPVLDIIAGLAAEGGHDMAVSPAGEVRFVPRLPRPFDVGQSRLRATDDLLVNHRWRVIVDPDRAGANRLYVKWTDGTGAEQEATYNDLASQALSGVRDQSVTLRHLRAHFDVGQWASNHLRFLGFAPEFLEMELSADFLRVGDVFRAYLEDEGFYGIALQARDVIRDPLNHQARLTAARIHTGILSGSGTKADPYVLDPYRLPNTLDLASMQLLAGNGSGNTDEASTHFSVTNPVDGNRPIEITLDASPLDKNWDLQWSDSSTPSNPLAGRQTNTSGALKKGATLTFRIYAAMVDDQLPDSLYLTATFGGAPAAPLRAPRRGNFTRTTLQAVTTPSPSTGASAATLYRFQLSRSSSFGSSPTEKTSAGLTADFDGLTHTTRYYCRVRAENASGQSPWSPVGELWTAGLPRTPTPTGLGVEVSLPFVPPGGTSYYVRLTANWDSSGAAATYYLAYLQPGGGEVDVTTAGVSFEVTLPYLRGFNYGVRIAARIPQHRQSYYTLWATARSGGDDRNLPPAVPPPVTQFTLTPTNWRVTNNQRLVDLRFNWPAVSGTDVEYWLYVSVEAPHYRLPGRIESLLDIDIFTTSTSATLTLLYNQSISVIGSRAYASYLANLFVRTAGSSWSDPLILEGTLSPPS